MSHDFPFDPAAEPYVSLATFRRNGTEVRTPVWIAGHQGCYYAFSAGDTGKVKRIRATGRVRLAACNFRGDIQSGWIEGEGRILDDGATALRALRAKYGFQMRLTDCLAKLSGHLQASLHRNHASVGVRSCTIPLATQIRIIIITVHEARFATATESQ
jgi:PPOX class probable F420-dependent enzyme